MGHLADPPEGGGGWNARMEAATIRCLPAEWRAKPPAPHPSVVRLRQAANEPSQCRRRWSNDSRMAASHVAMRGSPMRQSESRLVVAPVRHRITPIAVVLGAALLVGAASGCAGSSSQSERPDPDQMVDGG
jgi:hypothetical protein